MNQNQPPPLIPFRLAARQHVTQVSSVAYAAGAKLPTVKLPQVGWLAGIIVRVFGTMTGNAGGTATYVNAVEQAFNLISRFRLNGNGGNINLIDISGFDAYLVSHFQQRAFKLDAGGVGSSAVDPTLVKTPLTTVSQVVADFALTYFLPVNANQGLNFETGLINLQAQDATFTLDMDTATLASIYATNVPVPTSLTVEVSYLWYEWVDPSRVQIPPPLIVRLSSQDYSPVINGDNPLLVPRAGTLMQAIVAHKTDGVYSSTAVDEVGLKLNLNTTVYNMKGYQNRLINRMNLGVDLPAGVNAFDFYHASQAVSEGDSRDMFDLEQYSTFQLISRITGMTVPATSNIRAIYRTLQQLG
ncbi:MAG TPA: hypothetical protein VGO47_14795 [Chlamydiales bacterium]|jgi:hypothetical protein|nr:hypothetical protein [Chlamydiales bacterium]